MASSYGSDPTLDDDRTRVMPQAAPRSPDPDATLVAPARPAFDDDRTVLRPLSPKPAAMPSASVDDDHPTVIAPRRPVAAPTRTALSVDSSASPPPAGESSLALPAGFRLHEYRIDRLLGQGGFGLTYLAKDVNLNTRVAIKEYLPEDIAFRTSTQTVSANSIDHRDRYQYGLDSFLVEARTLATFRHPNIVRVARFFEAHQTAYMVLEYEHGASLKEWWPKHRDMAERELAPWLQPLLDGLAVVHATGFLHRDIKPDNIYVRDEDGSLVLLDFGSARQAVTTADEAYNAFTPGFAPIEQYQGGSQGAWTDVYGLGATLYWMIGGKRPPDAGQRQYGRDPMTSARECGKGRYSDAFLDAVDWALKPDAKDRPQTIEQFRAALFAGHAASLGIEQALRDAEPGTLTQRSQMQTRRRWLARKLHALRDFVDPGSWPLATKMTIAMVLTALLPMLCTAYYNLSGSMSAVSESELRNLEQLARSTAGRLSQLIGDSRNLARSMGTDLDFAHYLAEPTPAGTRRLVDKVDALVRANPDIHLLMVMNREGTAVVSSDPEVMGRTFRFREYFKAAMNGQPHTTGIVVGAVAGAAGMFFSYPVFDDSKQVIGAVVLRLKASSFTALLDEMRADSRRTPILVDGDGVVIYHPDAKLLYSSLVPLSSSAMEAIRVDQRFRRDRVASLDMPDLAQAMVGARADGHASYRSTLTKEAEIVGYAPLRSNDWVVGVTESRDSFEAPLNRLFTQLLWSVVLVGMLFLGLALRFARSIVRPINALTAAADALKAGDFARAGIKVETRDEVGQLARTFNIMIDVLRQRERERMRAVRRLP